ncbi:DUF4129 domain-containing protein ['Paenibacillus yunnanensis' Narsing Rao et al. 2020]|uniref:DUF4129 domain-containing protein n=1 Tax=Paenibacillus tengchongensis TaxID=2608684 RepID=UPI00124F115F|nr:DUF4129 domain-containing protein [Paenibacillus tengchongensis]
MKNNTGAGLGTEFKVYMAALMDWLLFLPVWLLLQRFCLPGERGELWLYTLPLVALAGAALRRFCSRKWKQLLAAVLLGLLDGWLLGLFDAWLIGDFPLMALPAAAVAVAYLGLTAAMRSRGIEIFLPGIGTYFVAAIAFPKIAGMEGSSSLLIWSGSLSLVLVLLNSSLSHLRRSSYAEEGARLPAGIRRLNFSYVLLFTAGAVLLAAGGSRLILMSALAGIRQVLVWITSLFSGSEEPALPEAAPPAAMPQLPGKAEEPGLLAYLLNLMFYALGTAILLVILYFLLRWLYRNSGGILRRAFDAVLSLLRRETVQGNSGYQDEESSVFSWEQTVKQFGEFFRDKLGLGAKRDRWEDMGGERERVRWLYRRWLQSRKAAGYEPKAYLTPLETEADVAAWEAQRAKRRRQEGRSADAGRQLLELYNQSRYGEGLPDAAEVAALKERMK